MADTIIAQRSPRHVRMLVEGTIELTDTGFLTLYLPCWFDELVSSFEGDPAMPGSNTQRRDYVDVTVRRGGCGRRRWHGRRCPGWVAEISWDVANPTLFTYCAYPS